MMSIFKDKYGDYRDIWVIISVFFGTPLAMLTIFTIIAYPIVTFTYFGDRGACDKFHQVIGYETKFVDNFPYSWSCQVKLPSGWIDYDRINNINFSQVED